jgi:hypothetical protein
MESSLTVSRRRPPSHMRDGHPNVPDRPFLVKRHRDGSHEQAHIPSDDDDIPSTRGEKHRRKKKHPTSSFNPPSSSGPRLGLSTDTYVERSQKSSRQKQGTSRSITDVPTTVTRPTPRGRKEVSRDGKLSSAKASSVVAASDDEVGPQPSYSGPIPSMEFNRMRRELEVLKKVYFFHHDVCCSSWNSPSNQLLTPRLLKSRPMYVNRLPHHLSLISVLDNFGSEK